MNMESPNYRYTRYSDRPCKCEADQTDVRPSIGRFMCPCGAELSLNTVLTRILRRLDELDERDSNLIQGLCAADMDECGHCGQWFKSSQLLYGGERRCCERCWDPWFFIREEDDDETIDHTLPDLMSNIAGGKYNNYYQKAYRDLLPKEKDGTMMEPFLTEWRKRTHNA